MPEREGYWWGAAGPKPPMQQPVPSFSAFTGCRCLGYTGGHVRNASGGRYRCAGRRKPKGKYDNFDKKSQGSLVHFGKVNVLHPSNTQRDAHFNYSAH
jgi:hypothetical protein